MWSRTHAPLPLVDPEKLAFCLDNNLNVLFRGRHGVGKTTVVRAAFERAGLNLLVFSGATMDPWVDFVGVPRPIMRANGTSVLELIRRPELADDAVDGIFIDEFNRAPAKVRNAALELLQFQSVNGHRFNRLRVVWAAINPDDDEYDTDRLDSAQLDRFHVSIEVPFRPCPKYFAETHGSPGRAAIEWWDSQSEEAKRKISPRRLDYAIRIALKGGPVRDVLPVEANTRRFLAMMEEGPIFDELKEMLAAGDVARARATVNDPQRGTSAIRHILGSNAAMVFFLPLLGAEKLISLLADKRVLDVVVKHAGKVPEFNNVLCIAANGNDTPFARKIRSLVKVNGIKLDKTQMSLVGSEGELESGDLEKIDPYGRLS